jgi:sugar lactone lactonase YvrE
VYRSPLALFVSRCRARGAGLRPPPRRFLRMPGLDRGRALRAERVAHPGVHRMSFFQRLASSLRSLPLALLAFSALACATPARRAEGPAVFFPPPPALPRLQFLTSFSGRKDIEVQSGFNRLVVGEQQDVRLDKPYGVAIHDGKIYVCDTNVTVVVFDLVHKTFGPLAGATGAGQLRQPVNIAIDADGTKYVSDPGRGQVVVFDKDDQYVRAYAAPGAWRPVDAVVFGDRLYVADPSVGLVHVFDRQSGEVVRRIGDQGAPDERLDRPTNLAFDREGYLYVSDVGRFQVVKYDRDGHFKAAFGRPGDNLGHFARPKGIALDRQGRLYAVDASFNNVQIFHPLGRLLMFFGQPGERPGDFQLPAQVAIDYDNVKYFESYAAPGFRIEYLVLVTSQFGPRLVNVFGFGEDTSGKYPSDDELIRQLDEQRRQELEKLPPASAPTAETPPATPPPGR